MVKMEKLNVVRFAADERQKRRLEEQGFKEASEPVKRKGSAADGRDKA